MDIIKHVAPLCYLCFYLFTSPLVTSVNVDHHLLSVQWPNSYCSVPFTSKTAGRKIPKCRRRIPQEFTIHGLWPQGSNSQRLRDCVNNSLPAGLSRTKKVLDKFMELQNVLHKIWPSLDNDDLAFWINQWESHGSCSGLEEQWVTATKRLYELADVAKLTGKFKVNTLYTVDEVQSIISSVTKWVTTVKCSIDRNGHIVFHEIHFCADASARILKNCSEIPGWNASRGCTTNRAIFPPLP
ncbi:hypothetical protein M0R45_033719 [Rubus argutus]|uniref:Uncharacterized protein n=1 Tax=Rubus argutus TaxID=59490 RepID=A0AAW1WQ23_RUBAR